ncbi:uroporphyrinogen-III synthase [Haloarchaeobius sp. DFWS5]|uniref:uroporphyrinogen-III synthase n=1 Tax=Haloarchaeobius sp. DFWS5 TaxID=3446114 RepID=UPI003EBDCE9A
MTTRDLSVAVFRPDDERLANAVELVESLGATPVADPMLEVKPSGLGPREGANYTILTSKTGAELARAADWNPGETTVCAIGPATAAALREQGYDVDIVPDEYSSTGLVATLADEVEDATVEIARSDHGSDVLLEGLWDANAFVHHTVLYELVRPAGAGVSVDMAVDGDLDAAAFTSSLTVENFVSLAEERGVRAEALAGLNEAVVGVIGEPTRETAESLGIRVDVVPENADFEELACAVVEEAAPTYHD